jgi:subfamily B ATP-binding cassette protein MsbA
MNWRLPRSLLALARPYPWVVPTLVVLGVLASLAEGIGIGLLIPVLDDVIGGPPGRSTAGPLAQWLSAVTAWIPADYHLPVLALLIVVLVAIKTALMIANTGVSAWIDGRVAHDLRVVAADRMLDADYALVASLDQGRLVNLFEHQTDRVGVAMTLFANLLGAACTVLVFVSLLALLSWQLALLVLAVVLPVSLFVRTMTRRANQLGTTLVRTCSALSTRILEVVNSVRTIRLFGGEGSEARKFTAASDDVRRAAFRMGLLTGTIQPTVEFMYVPVFLAVFGYALHAGIGLPTLFAFLALLYRLQTPLKRLDHVRVELSAHAAAIEEIGGLLREADAHPAPSGAIPFERLHEGIEFDQVCFGYAGGAAPALFEVSLRMRRGEVVALIGPSGAGKSTLVNLLCRLYEPTAGRILVDGAPLSQFDTRSWRSRIAFAGQDADLLLGTIRENIAFAAPGASDEQIRQAIRLAHAASFVDALPAGLETEVGPGGRKLSGGQRQRIALARAFIRQPDLLILDEATNAVDSVTESEIQAAIDALAGRCTILIIAHRVGTLRRADRVVVLDGGRVVEQGPPEQVMAAEGVLERQNVLD